MNCLTHQLPHSEVVKERQAQFKKRPFQHCNPSNGQVRTDKKCLQRKGSHRIDRPRRLCMDDFCEFVRTRPPTPSLCAPRAAVPAMTGRRHRKRRLSHSCRWTNTGASCQAYPDHGCCRSRSRSAPSRSGRSLRTLSWDESIQSRECLRPAPPSTRPSVNNTLLMRRR